MDTAQKLCVLHLLASNQDTMDKELVEKILTSLDIFKPLEIDITLGDLIKNGLIKESGQHLVLKDEGLVVIEFFRDRIDLETQEKIEAAVQAQKPKSYWMSDYVEEENRLYLSYQKENKNLMKLEMDLEGPAYELIKDNLENLQDQDFVNLKKFFLNM